MKMSLSASWLKKPIVIALIASICIALALSMGIGIAENPAATITLSPDSGYGNTIVTVSGSGFTGSKAVEVYFAGITVLSTMTGPDGFFVGQFVIPTDQSGEYVVSAVDGEGIKASTSFKVVVNPMLTDLEKKLDKLLGGPPPTEGLTVETKIGALLDFTGDLADYGNASKAAINLAVGEVNELLGEAGAPWTLEILFRDTQTKPEVALEELKKLWEVDKVQFVIGPLSSGEVRTIKEYADANKILVISHGSTLPDLAIPDDYIFRFCAQDVVQGRAIARLMCDDGISTVVAVYRNDTWGTGLLGATEKRFKELTGKEFAKKMPYDPQAPDFPTLAADLNTAVKTLRAQGVLYIGFEEVVTFFTAASAYDVLWKVKWYGSDGTVGNKELITNTKVAKFCAATGFINTVFSPTKSDKYKRVHDALYDELGRDPDSYAYVAYDIVWALTYSLSLANRYDSVAVKAVLPEVTESLFGATGWIVLNEAGDRVRGDYDLWRIMEVATGVYDWKHVGTWLYDTDSITWL